MDSQIISVLNALCDKIGIAVDWTTENVGPQIEMLLEQYAQYLLVGNIVGTLVASFIFVVSTCLIIVTVRSHAKKTWAYDEYDDEYNWIGFSVMLGSIFALVISGVCLLFCIDGLIESVTIPQIYAAQELLSMLQQ